MPPIKKFITTLLGWQIAHHINPGSGGFSLNAAPTGGSGRQILFAFIPDTDKVLTACKFFFTTTTGTVGAGDIQLDIETDNGGVPSGTVLTSSTTWSNAWSGTNYWNEATVAATGVSGGNMYWMVLKNVGATPTANYVNVQNVTINGMMMGSSSPNTWGIKNMYTTNGRTSWSQALAASYRITYTDGYEGTPSYSPGPDTTRKIYSTNYNGSLATLPGRCIYNVIGVAMPVAYTGTPTGKLLFSIYDPTNLLASTPGRSVSGHATGNWVSDYFSTTLQILGGSTIRVVAQNSAEDSSSNYYTVYRALWDTDVNSLALLPMGGNIVQTSYNGSTWTEQAAGTFVPFVLLLDPDNPYMAPTLKTGGGWNIK